MTSLASYGLVWLSLLASLLLSIFPLPFAYQWLRPEWTAMVVIYWVVTMPWRIGVGVAWLAGLVLDAFQGVTLGQNALGLAVITYIGHQLHQRLRHFAVWQQAAVVFVLIGLHSLLGHWVQGIALSLAGNLNFLLSAATSALCWPLFTVCMRAWFGASSVRHA